MNEMQKDLAVYVKKELNDHFQTWEKSWIVDYFTPLLHGKLTKEQIEVAVNNA